MSALVHAADIRMRYYAKAKQYLYDRHRLDTAGDDELTSVADYLRHWDFMAAVEPYVRQKNRIVSGFYSLQPNVQLPKILEEALAAWDELIAIEARKFGYEPEDAT